MGVGGTTAFKALTLDVELYQSYIDDPEMSKADKRALVKALWLIMVSCVDLGYDIHPLQHPELGEAFTACGQIADVPKVKRDKRKLDRVTQPHTQQSDQDRAVSQHSARQTDS
ncbi:MAG: hypothetical protein AAGH60_02735 [Pseudomonadota bacterium]